jgi:hypothetical protein
MAIKGSKATRPSKRTPRILRLGLIQADTVLEERLIRKRESVTLGPTPRCSFIVPVQVLSKPVPVLHAHKGIYWVVYQKGMGGRVSIGGQVLKLEDAARLPSVQRKGPAVLIPLDDNSRGKIKIGELSVLFQFVARPPTMPKPQLPASARGSIWKQIDYTLLTILLSSFLVQGGSVGGLDFWWEHYGQYEQETFRQRRKKIVHEALLTEVQLQKKQEEEKQEEIDEAAEADDAAEEEVAPTPAPKPVKKTKPKAAPKVAEKKPTKFEGKKPSKAELEARRQKRIAKVRSNTLLKYVGSAGGKGSLSAGDALSRGVNNAKLSKAWESKGGVRVAQAGERGTYVGGPKAAAGAGSYAPAKLTGKELGGKGIKTKKVETAAKQKEQKIKLRIGGKLGSQAGLGKIDRASVSKTFRRRMGAVKYCYQKALQKNQEAGGKIVIQFTIGMAGRVTSIAVTHNDTGDANLGKCITGKVKGWRFPKPDKGAVTFSFPFILKKG